jgi:hypothetical protein
MVRRIYVRVQALPDAADFPMLKTTGCEVPHLHGAVQTEMETARR